MYKINKQEFYQKIKIYCSPFLKATPIAITMNVENSKYKIILEEFFQTTDKKKANDFVLQIIDTTKTGYEKYVCDDIWFNLDDEKIYTDYQCYKWINKKINEKITE